MWQSLIANFAVVGLFGFAWLHSQTLLRQIRRPYRSAIFGVATSPAPSGATVEAAACGVFELAKTSAQAWTVGAKVYWDDAAKLCTTVNTSNTLISVAVAAAANPSATGLVRLNGAF